MKIYRQRPIDHYTVDFYVASKKLAIEVDGSQHYLEEGSDYDQKRDAALAVYGIRVLRIHNSAVRNRYEDVCRMIERELGM